MLQTVTDHRMQIYLPAVMYKALKREAGDREISLAEVIREAIKKQFMTDYRKDKDKFRKAKFKFLNLAGAGKGPADLSIRHDDYV